MSDSTTSKPSVVPSALDVTLRDRFAMAALPPLIATAADRRASGTVLRGREAIVEAARSCGWESETELHDGADGPQFTLANFLAMEAYTLADAMIRQRERP